VCTQKRLGCVLIIIREMEIKLACQTCNNSIADLFEFCFNIFEFEDFDDVDSNIRVIFCKTLNKISDCINTRNFVKYWNIQNPPKINDDLNIQHFIEEYIIYLKPLTV